MRKEEYDSPDWEKNWRRDDWRAFVGNRTIKIWSTLNDEQKNAIAMDAEDEYHERAAEMPV